MTYVDQSDGITYLSAGECWHVSGTVTVKLEVTFDTTHDTDEPGFMTDLLDALSLNGRGDVDDIIDVKILDMEGREVTAEVMLDVYVRFRTAYEPDTRWFETELEDALKEVIWDEYDVIDTDLEFEAEEVERE